MVKLNNKYTFDTVRGLVFAQRNKFCITCDNCKNKISKCSICKDKSNYIKSEITHIFPNKEE